MTAFHTTPLPASHFVPPTASANKALRLTLGALLLLSAIAVLSLGPSETLAWKPAEKPRTMSETTFNQTSGAGVARFVLIGFFFFVLILVAAQEDVDNNNDQDNTTTTTTTTTTTGLLGGGDSGSSFSPRKERGHTSPRGIGDGLYIISKFEEDEYIDYLPV
jgi:magnesium-transporting ATPase (P-type)